MKKKKIGIVVGRFQPFHSGHLYIINKALKENNKVIVCIGSPKKNETISFKENYKKINSELKKLKKRNYRIIKIEDIGLPSYWPAHLVKKCKLTNKTSNYLYKSERNIPEKHKKELEEAGIHLKFVKRKKFLYKDSKGKSHRISSANEIRKLN